MFKVKQLVLSDVYISEPRRALIWPFCPTMGILNIRFKAINEGQVHSVRLNYQVKLFSLGPNHARVESIFQRLSFKKIKVGKRNYAPRANIRFIIGVTILFN